MKLKVLSVGLFLFSLVFFPSQALAVGNLNSNKTNLSGAAQPAGYTEGDIGNITGQIINTALQLVGIIFLALMVYAGYLWMTAQGDESQIEKAKKIVTSAIIGLVLTMSAYAITALVTKKLGNAGSAAGGPDGGGACADFDGAACRAGCAQPGLNQQECIISCQQTEEACNN